MIFNMVGGGSGGLKATDAVLIVSVPTGSTVTATKSGVTLTPTMWVQNADNTLDTAIFSVKASTFDSNPWTVTATLNGDTASDTVVINSAKEYSMELSLRVPSGYTEVEYITFPSGAYIDTGVTSSPSRKTEIKLNDPSYLKDKHYFGDSGNSGGSTYHMTTFDNKYYWGSGSGEGDGGTWASGIAVITYNDANNSYIPTLNGTNLASSNSDTVRSNLVYIGRRGTTANFVGDVYYFFMWNNSDSTFVRRMYPCYRNLDSVVGFWDKVSETFFTNAGSGTLVAGPTV